MTNFDKLKRISDIDKNIIKEEYKLSYDANLEDIGLPIRILNCLYRTGCKTIVDVLIIGETGLKNAVGISNKSIKIINEIIADYINKPI